MRRFAAALLLIAGPASAQDAAPTVSLTRPELDAIVKAEQARAVAADAAEQAKAAYDKVKAAFAPKAPAALPSPPSSTSPSR